MNNNKLKMIEGWIDKASIQSQAAEKHLTTGVQYSESILAAQVCIELAVKAVLAFLNIEFSPSHEWKPDKKEFAAIAHQIQERQLLHKLADQYIDSTIRLPRLLFLINFGLSFTQQQSTGSRLNILLQLKNCLAKKRLNSHCNMPRNAYGQQINSGTLKKIS